MGLLRDYEPSDETFSSTTGRHPVPGPRSAQAAKYEEWRVCETVRRAAASAAPMGWREGVLNQVLPFTSFPRQRY